MSAAAGRAPRWLVLAGVPIGFAGSLAGIGGGLIAASLLHFAFGFELRRATGTALVLVLATTGASTLTELLSGAPALSPVLLFGMWPGVLLGAQLGFRLSERLPDRALRAVFAVCMLYSAARLATGSGAVAERGVEALALDAPTLLAGLVAGIGGGMAAPLLGVGGGLVMVPVLHLGLGLSFDLARASSLATGCLGALRSLRLKARAGRVSFGHGAPLALGALVGAASGVVALKRWPALTEVGRWTLCALLLYVGLRFARAVLRPATQA